MAPCHGVINIFDSDRMCAMVPLPPPSLHSGSSLMPHLCKCVGFGSVSYTDRSRKEISNDSNFHRSAHVIFLLGRSHLVQAPLDANSAALDLRLSSSRFHTSSWIMALLSLVSAVPHCWKWEVPRPCLPAHGIPMMSRSSSMLSACATEV